MVLKVAHHGSKNSTSQEFLQQVSPEFALISCGKNNSYGHPHKDLLERLDEAGAMAIRTDKRGAVHISVKNGKMSAKYGSKYDALEISK
jgi:competence protein ComEC